jgi:adhesin/invasin
MDGFIFINWIGDAVGTSNNVIVSIGADKTVAANFLEITWGEPATVTLIAEPFVAIADGNQQIAIQALVEDANSNLIPGQVLTFTSSLGTISQIEPTTNAAGIATAVLTSTTSGFAMITTKAAEVSGQAQVQFIAGPLSSVEVNASPTTLLADGLSTATITVVVKDAHNNPVPNQTVTFATTLGRITDSSVTDATGVATATLTSVQQVGLAQVTASAGSLSTTAEVTFAGRVYTGVVFVDQNRSGAREAGEAGMANVVAEMTLMALAAGSEQTAAASLGSTWRSVSDATGTYRFADLPLGTYTLTLQFPRGYSATTPTTFTVTVGTTGQDAAPEAGALAQIYLPSIRR